MRVSGQVVGRQEVVLTSTNEPRTWLVLQQVGDDGSEKQYVVVGDGPKALELAGVPDGTRLTAIASVGGRSYWNADIVPSELQVVAGDEAMVDTNEVDVTGVRKKLAYKATTENSGELFDLVLQVGEQEVTVKITEQVLAQLEGSKDGDTLKVSGRLWGFAIERGSDKGKVLMRVYAQTVKVVS